MTERSPRKVRTGVVISSARDKTITIEVRSASQHVRYAKTVQHRKRMNVHDEGNDARVGDTVKVVETRPLSKTKRWRMVEIVERAR